MSTKSPAPYAACADFALLLPLASHGLLDPTDRAALARHLDTCAHCRGELALHDQTDAALRQALGQGPAAAAPWTRSEILSLLVEDSPVAIVTGHAVSPPLTALGVQPSRAIMAAPRVAARNNARGPARPHESIGTIAAALLVALLAGTLFALAQDRGGPTGTRAPASLPAGLAVQAVAMISPTEGWAAGSVTAVPYYPKLVVLHYAAGRWSVALVALPSALGRQSAVLTGIAMVSPTEGWAVGHTVLGHAPGGEVDGWTSGILLHDVGGTWRDANAAGAPWDALNRAGGYQLLDVVADRSGTAWIVGTDGTGAALVLRGGAAGWARMSDPALAGVAPTAAAADPAGGLWIAGVDDTAGPGFDGNAPGVVLHFDGRVWTRPPLPDPRIRVAGLAPTASGTVWAVGTLPGQASEGGGADLAHPGAAVVLRGGGGVWTVAVRFASPSGAPRFGFADVALAPDDTGWAVGMDGALAHLVGGRWERVASPTSQDLLCVALTSSADGWAFGADGVILRATGGVWRRYGQ
jgi:hypothetical protein